MRVIFVLVLFAHLAGCAYYLTPRPPVAERKLGRPGSESVGVLATAPDYRVVYVKVRPDAQLCAEAPADVAGQFASSFAAALAAPTAKPKDGEVTAGIDLNMAVAMKQIFRRSQGIQFFRDGAFALCNLYLNGVLDRDAYLREIRELRIASAKLIEAELDDISELEVDSSAAPTVNDADVRLTKPSEVSAPESTGNVEQAEEKAPAE